MEEDGRVAKELENPRVGRSGAGADARERLRARLRAPVRARSVETPIPPRDGAGDGRIPLSSAQEGLWFIDQLTGPSALYTIARAFTVEGPLDVPALERATGQLIARHESLRTAFTPNGDAAVQTVWPAAAAAALSAVHLDDLAADSTDERQRVRDAWLRACVERPFDLSRPPLLRLDVLRLAPDAHVVLVLVHHIVADGWSLDVLARELAAFYAAERRGETAALPALPIQFPDFAVWERRRLSEPAVACDLDYWRQRLHGLDALPFPTDRPRGKQPTIAGAQQVFAIPLELVAALKGLSQREDVTLFMLLLAAFQVLCARYSGSRDVAVGSPVAGRSRTEVEGLIGYFVSSLVLRTDLGGDPTFRDALARVKQVCLDAYAHQEGPFDRLVAELRPERDVTRHPLYQVSFALQNMPAGELALEGARTAPLPFHTGTAKFDLALTLTDGSAGLTCVFEYCTALFDAETITRLARHYTNLLTAIVADPTQPLSDLTLLDARERIELLDTWNDTARDYPALTLSQLFEAQVRRSPDAPAVCFEGEVLTYAALDHRANALAHHLRAEGVGPDVLVGICLHRSPAMLVAVLAIVKAGGAYVPLDPRHPRERLAYMLDDTSAPVVVTEAALAHLFSDTPARVVIGDGSDGSRFVQPDTDPAPSATLDHLAYVIYTSGSTGAPKGVAIPHRGICNHNHWLNEQVHLGPDDRVLLQSSIGFDASAWEIFGPLAVGASLVVAKDDGRGDSEYIVGVIRRDRVTVATAVPSELAVWLDEPSFAECHTLRYLIAGGEALDRALARRFRQVLPTATLANSYGPTEVSVDSTCFEVDTIADGPGTVPIGRPIANTRGYILDEHGQLVPIGVAGELFVGGLGLARGYLNRPELTAERFIENPLRPGERVYRTGDLTRYLPNGLIEYLGRVDRQVKLRGFRIELGEIEAVLGACSGVRHCAVLLREDQPGLEQLVAYVVGPTPDIDLAALNTELDRRLPAHMRPTAIVPLPALPLTVNGKLDHAALPAPDLTASLVGFTEPRTPVEARLVDIWRELLGTGRVGVLDSFFDLGGHSLLATRLMARLRRDFGREMPLSWIFEAPTIAGLAARLEAHTAPGSDEPPIERVDVDEPASASASQEGLWFIERLLGPSPLYHVPYAAQVSGAIGKEVLERAVRALVDRHESLRTAFEQRDGTVVQVVCPPERVRDRVLVHVSHARDVDARGARAEIVETWLRVRSGEPFDVTSPPLLRVEVLHLGATDHVVLLVVHHIVADGWSLAILIRELGALYTAFQAGRPTPELTDLPVRFTDYARWERTRCGGSGAERDLGYWRGQLANLEAVPFPTDRPRAARSSHRGAVHRFTVDGELLSGLQTLARREDVTLFMLLLGAFQSLLLRYSGCTDIAVGSPVAGRTRPELEGLVGHFVNTLVLRTDLSGNPTVTGLLHRVKKVCLDAYAHQELPFDRLVAELSPRRDSSRHPLFQISFSLLNLPDAMLALDGQPTMSLPVHTGTAKFDLALALAEERTGLTGVLEYSTDLFDAETIARLARHYTHHLRAIAADPTARLAELPVLEATERQQMLVAWNDTARPCPPLSVHALFEVQVRRDPDAPAVCLGADRLTYGELNRRANRLAHHLRTLGVGPDVPVGLCMHRSPAMVVALLGILKAGGAYVPLDVHYPRERLAFMLADTAAPVVIVDPSLRALVPTTQSSVLYGEHEERAFAHLPSDNPPAVVTPDHLAYVIYTSGSTGTPKGVAVPHRAVVRLVVNTDYVRLEPSDSVAQASNSSFDAATFEIWGALVNGGRLVIVPREVLLSGPALRHAIEHERINTMFMTTALFNEYAAKSPSLFQRLDHLIVGGEALDPAAVQRVLDAAPPRRLLNGYGPTETTTFAVCHEIPREPRVERATVPIGRPIANTLCYVLDPSGEPVPVGVVGELYIGGPGVARGYWNRPELTAEKFVADPFRPGETVYRTGDFARYRPDGILDYIGRVDGQVKIRGFRIELGEIEARLAREPGVGQCAVAVHVDEVGGKRLVAYVVAADRTAPPAAHDLRRRLATELPPHMVPAAVVMLEALPLTANGKLDRRALPSPTFGPEDRGEGGGAAGPANDVERQLQGIWQEVLKTSPIHVEHSFFDLGGHSLLAIKLLDVIHKEFGCTLGLAAIFEAPTIRAQAALIGQRPERRSTCAVAIQPKGGRPPLFFVSGFGGQLLPYRPLARELGADQPLYVLDLNSLPEHHYGDTTLEAIASEMVRDMRKVQPRGPYHLAGYSLGGKVVYEIAQQLGRAGESVGLLALLDCSAPGYPRRRGFLVRTVLHIKHAWSLGRSQMGSYLVTRVRRLKKYVGLVDEPRVFKAGDEVHDTAIARDIEARAQPIYGAWRAYVPARYRGRMTLVRAGIRDSLPGVVDDDLLMGWGPLIGGGVDVAVVLCAHDEMLDATHSRALASVLAPRLSDGPEQLDASTHPAAASG